ncbi:MAG: hypothetical protein BroJett025_09390 [Patescibacteria group bacterium]|nr:MAG: hypothetical protein BroJett025_09390 [Patescibacteria group bacterium]
MNLNDPLMIVFLLISLLISYTIPGPEEDKIIVFEDGVVEETFPPPEETEVKL